MLLQKDNGLVESVEKQPTDEIKALREENKILREQLAELQRLIQKANLTQALQPPDVTESSGLDIIM